MEIDFYFSFFSINIRICKYRNIMYRNFILAICDFYFLYLYRKEKKHTIYITYSKSKNIQKSIEILYIS